MRTLHVALLRVVRAELSRGPDPTPVGLRLEGDASFEQWREIGRKLGKLNVAATWALADWTVYGARFAKYGERYTEAVALTRLDEHTLRNYAVIARAFPIARRRPTLSIGHHGAVVALPPAEQDAWLERAERERLSVNELRSRVRDARLLAPAAPAAALEQVRSSSPIAQPKEERMEVKIFDLRDSGTESGAFAIRLQPGTDLERDVLERRGFRGGFIVGTLGPAPVEATYDRFHWDNGEHVRANRTMFRAHGLIASRWDDLTSGDLLDLDDPRNAVE